MKAQTSPSSNQLISPRVEYLILALIIMVGAFYRLNGLAADSLGFDEAVLWKIASQPSLLEVVKLNAIENSAPPLYASAIHFLLPWVTSDGGIRLLSLLAGVLAIPMFYLLMKRMAGPVAALAGSGIVALSSSQIFYSYELREYSLSVLLTILIFNFYLVYMDSSSTASLLGLILLSVVGLATQYGIALIIPGLVLATFFQFLRDRKAFSQAQLRGLAIYVLAALASVLVVYFSALRFQLAPGGFAGSGGRLTSGYWDGTWVSLLTLLWDNSWLLLDFSFLPYTSSLFFFLAVFGALALRKSGSGGIKLHALMLPVLVTVLFAMFSLYPYIGGRQNIVLTVSIYVLVAFGLEQLFQQNRVVFFSVSAVVILLAIEALPIGGREIGYREGIEQLCADVSTDDYIYVDAHANAKFEFYWQLCEARNPKIESSPELSLSGATPPTHIFLNEEGPELLANYAAQNIWVVMSNLNELERSQLLSSVERLTGKTPAEYFSAAGSRGGAWIYLFEAD